MRKRRLGGKLEVSAIGLGCMSLSGAYGGALSMDEAVAMLRGAFLGEQQVGKGLGPVRDQVVIATKFGFKLDPENPLPQGFDSRPEHIRQVCDASLQRLGIDKTGDGRVDAADVRALTRADAARIYVEHYFRRPRLAEHRG